MKLESFDIKHVKSIKDSENVKISLTDNICVLAGQNEAGKSAVLEALNYFRNGNSEKFKKSWRLDSAVPYVKCTFTIDGSDRVSDNESLTRLLKAVTEVSFVRQGDNEIELITDLPNTSDTAPENVNEGEDVVSATDSPENTLEIAKKHLVDRIPAFIFFDSFRDILPGEIRLRDIDGYAAVKDFEKVFNINFKDLAALSTQQRSANISRSVETATVDLNKYWSQNHTTEEDDKYYFDIKFNLDENDHDNSTVTFMVHRNDHSPLFIEQKSQGFQWFNSFNLRLKSIDFDSGNGGMYILLIDEPGQGLHETAQTDVKKILEELASKGTEIIYSTHNPMLIGVEDTEIVRIKLVYQGKRDVGTKIQNIAQFSTQEGSIDALSPIITAMGISHVGQVIDRTKLSVALEGISDHYYFTAMKKYLNISQENYFIPACGADNLPALASILIGWGSNYRVILDDGNKGRSIFNKIKKHMFHDNLTELREKVRKLDGFDGIEDLFSRSDFLKFILEVESDPDITKKNSVLAKDSGKELLARKFLLKATTSHDLDLESETKENFQSVFDWLYNGTT